MTDWTQPNARDVMYRRDVGDCMTLALYGDTHGEWFLDLRWIDQGRYSLVDTLELTSPFFRADSHEEAQTIAERFAREALEAMTQAATALREGLNEE